MYSCASFESRKLRDSLTWCKRKHRLSVYVICRVHPPGKHVKQWDPVAVSGAVGSRLKVHKCQHHDTPRAPLQPAGPPRATEGAECLPISNSESKIPEVR